MQALTTRRRAGFTLIELVIVLGVVGVVSVGLFRLMATSSQQTKDQATAQQQAALIDAVKGYLADPTLNSGQALLTAMGPQPATQALPLPTSNSSVSNCIANYQATYPTQPDYQAVCNFLPANFTANTTNPYGQTYAIRVTKDANAAGTAPQSYAFMIVTSGGATIPDADGGRIAGLIGGDGGFIYTSPVCTPTASNVTACGALGAWQTTTTLFGYPGSSFGTVASRTFVSTATLDSSNYWLARKAFPGDSATLDYNTMHADLYMQPVQFDSGTGLYDLQAGKTASNMYLEQGSIIGTGTVDGKPQLDIETTYAQFKANAGAPLIQVTSGCTTNNNAAVNTAVYDPNCPEAVTIYGDMSSTGIVYQTKNISTSDARLKTDIHPLQSPLSDLMKIQAVGFRWKNGGGQDMGVTAQNLEQTYPQLVTEHKGIKYVEYNGLIGPLIGAVQELKRENDDLRQELRDQRQREERLERRLNAGQVD